MIVWQAVRLPCRGRTALFLYPVCRPLFFPSPFDFSPGCTTFVQVQRTRALEARERKRNDMSVMWNLWHGCHKISEGCRHCYVYRRDSLYDKDSRVVARTAAFDLPLKRRRNGDYRIPSGTRVYTCFTSDFFLAEADPWRAEAWAMIRRRSDLSFIIPTKRIDRSTGIPM